eukprot:CAMPEP_0115563932 /NCGR_PEP_ID=MMETSP0271-20121206/102293_1 /TAXON_ID=71861 /ORGANISM="Scrippsiella trochoidea, Strain CCMP3099" /LENGTH=96 /DNA_ID=CAMNT_0002998163 /DNA_START=649 /DNA_END=939 /DNA_ORIENTATION=+
MRLQQTQDCRHAPWQDRRQLISPRLAPGRPPRRHGATFNLLPLGSPSGLRGNGCGGNGPSWANRMPRRCGTAGAASAGFEADGRRVAHGARDDGGE